MRRIVFLGVLAVPLVWSASEASTIDSELRYAYGANIGWISLRHDQPTPGEGVTVGSTFLSGYAYAANVGWINFGNGHPANGTRYSNATRDDFGVNLDGLGNLSGYAYGANIGWISFQWHAESHPPDNRPSINLREGTFSGYAYGANVGWINLGTGYLKTAVPTPTTVALQAALTGENILTLTWEAPVGGMVEASETLTADAWHAVGAGQPRPEGGWLLEIPLADSPSAQFFRWIR